MNEDQIEKLKDVGADAFGFGTYVSGTPPIDFALDVVEVEGKPAAKREKLGGKKRILRWTIVSVTQF